MLLAVALAGCGGGLETSGLSLPAVPIPKVEIPKVAIPKIELPDPALPVVGTPTEVYTRVARGALNCWFGVRGPLKGRYIYHADAESPARGGKAEIAVHELDRESKDPRGGRALKIFIVPEGDGTKVSYENQKLPPDLAEAMRKDVDRWAADRMGCEPASPNSAWTSVTLDPGQSPPDAAPAAAAKSVTKAATRR